MTETDDFQKFKKEMQDYVKTSSTEDIVGCLVNMMILLDTKDNLNKDSERLKEFENTYEVQLPKEVFDKTMYSLKQQMEQRKTVFLNER